MARSPVHTPSALRSRYEQRTQRLTALRSVRATLISLAGLVSRPVTNEAGALVGTVADVVAHWDDIGQPYPAVTGLVIRVGHRRAWVPIDQVAAIRHAGVELASSLVDLRDFTPRGGEVELFREVVDHQLVDTGGARVVRASDLYLADVAGTWQLVGVDVGFASIVRRLGPARLRVRPTPDKVIDWASIHSFGRSGSGRNLRAADQGLRRMRPGELADLLEDLGRRERRELLAHLDPEQAADALEEMEAEELSQLLRESEVTEAGRLLGQMEPDEAAEALRQLDDDEQSDLLAAMPLRPRSRVVPLLDYDEGTAGGVMTSLLVTATPTDTVASVRQRLRELREHDADLVGVVVVDDDGRLIDDLTMTELFLADLTRTVHELIGPPWPVTVEPEAGAQEVAARLVEARTSSVVVVDADQRPLGRILADDVVDALLDNRSAVGFPRRLS